MFKHIQVHGLAADSYRSIFGLRVSQSLLSPVNSDERAERTGEQMRAMPEAQRKEQVERLARYRREFTPEQRSTWALAREERLQSQMPGSFHDPEANRARANTFHEQRRQDPEKDRAWRGKLIVAKRRRLAGQECVVCGCWFCVVNARGVRQVSQRATCGSEDCKREVKRRAQAKATESRRAKRAAAGQDRALSVQPEPGVQGPKPAGIKKPAAGRSGVLADLVSRTVPKRR